MSLPVLVISFCSLGQDSTGVTTLREVVVSASRTEQPVIEVPRSVTVIDGEILRTSVYQSVGDLLNAWSGLYVVGANQTPGTNQNLFMRGASSNQVAVLIDGVRITDPSTPNAALDLSEISLANIQRIEVIRGSHSTMFGGAAIGGVINLITSKDPAPGLHGDVSWQSGLFGRRAWSSTEQVALNYGAAHGWYVNSSLFRQDANGLDSSEKPVSNPSFTSDADDFNKIDASLKAGFRSEGWDANISFKRIHQYTEIDNGAFSDDDNNYLDFDRDILQYHARYEFNKFLSASLIGSRNDSERFYENDSSKISATAYDRAYSKGTYYGKLQTHEAQFNYEKGNLKGVVGTGLYADRMSFDNYFFYNDPDYPLELVTNYDTLNTRTTTKYVFSQAGYGWDNFQISGGMRFSSHSTAGNFLTFELNPSIIFQGLLLYGSFSTGFNAPSLYQLYDPSRSFAAYTTRGNPDLEPERSESLEAGIKKEFSRGSYVTLSAYRTKVTNAIEYIYLWNGSRAVEDLDFMDSRGDTYVNVGEQLAKGLELESFVRIADDLSLQGNISLLSTRITVEPENVREQQTGGHHVQLYNLGAFLEHDIRQDDLVRRPDLTAFTRLRYRPVEKLTLSASYRYTGTRFDSGYDPLLGPYGALSRTEVEAYHLLDAGIAWQAGKVLGIALQMENLLGEDYREVVGFQTRGRSVYLKVMARW